MMKTRFLFFFTILCPSLEISTLQNILFLSTIISFLYPKSTPKLSKVFFKLRSKLVTKFIKILLNTILRFSTLTKILNRNKRKVAKIGYNLFITLNVNLFKIIRFILLQANLIQKLLVIILIFISIMQKLSILTINKFVDFEASNVKSLNLDQKNQHTKFELIVFYSKITSLYKWPYLKNFVIVFID